MTEARATYTVSGTTVKLWRCDHCKHVLGEVIEGVCIVHHYVKLSRGEPVVVCPICKTEVKWYSYAVERE